MSWADTAKAMALTALAGRTAMSSPTADVTWNWNGQDVWLKRVEQPRERTARSTIGEQLTPTQQGTVSRD
jgi:hypothetical protein